MRMRPSALEKKLLEELLPICMYVQASYRPGRYTSVRWLKGNQAYDAEVRQVGAHMSAQDAAVANVPRLRRVLH
jgi:hypothetical protein